MAPFVPRLSPALSSMLSSSFAARLLRLPLFGRVAPGAGAFLFGRRFPAGRFSWRRLSWRRGAALALMVGGGLAQAGAACAQSNETATAAGLARKDETGGEQAHGRDLLVIGVGGASIPSYVGSNDARLIPVLVVNARVDGHMLFTRGTDLYVDATRMGSPRRVDFAAGPLAGVRLDRTSGIDDARVRALGKRKATMELGGWIGLAKTGVLTSAYDSLSARLSWQRDVSGVYDSYVVHPSLAYASPLSTKTYVSLSVSADYVGRGFGHSYYDIAPEEGARAGLAAYDRAGAKAGFSRWSLGLVGSRALSGDLRSGWMLVGGLSYGRMLGRYARSPIVDDAGSRDQWTGGLGIARSF